MRLFLHISRLILFCTCMLLLSQCGQDNVARRISEEKPGRDETLLKANKEAVRAEDEQINDYISRHHLKMDETGTGIRYQVTRQGIGPKAVRGKTVKLDYTIMFLTGDTVYTASKEGPLVFEIGKGQVITGLEEAILLLRVGDRAKFIIPSHLAFGLIGDQKKINQKASLVYDIDFISMY